MTLQEINDIVKDMTTPRWFHRESWSSNKAICIDNSPIWGYQFICKNDPDQIDDYKRIYKITYDEMISSDWKFLNNY